MHHDTKAGMGLDTIAASQPPAKKVLLCADDFGLHVAVDQAIFELAEQGRMNCASCLVDGPSFVANAQLLVQADLQIGLHLNFTEALTSPGVRDVRFVEVQSLPHLMAMAWMRRLNAAAVRAEIARQLDRFLAVVGRFPDYIDGHQHVHQFPVIRDALMAELLTRQEAAPMVSRPWLRSTWVGSVRALPAGTRVKAAMIQSLGARRFRRLAGRHEFPLNRRLLGVYGFEGGAEGYHALLTAWLAMGCDGDLIMCHPAKTPVPGDVLGAQRVAEFQALTARDLQTELDRHNVRLAGDACFEHTAG